MRLERGHANAELMLVLEVIQALDLTMALHDIEPESHTPTGEDTVDLDAVLAELG